MGISTEKVLLVNPDEPRLAQIKAQMAAQNTSVQFGNPELVPVGKGYIVEKGKMPHKMEDHDCTVHGHVVILSSFNCIICGEDSRPDTQA